MRTAGNKAFTMVELLLVIVIIGILATLVVPAVIRAIWVAKKVACNVSVRDIVMGLKQYSNPTEEMPYVPQTTWNTRIATNLLNNPFTAAAAGPRNHSANLWLLVREEHVAAGAFVCPGTTDAPNTHQRVKATWDFGPYGQVDASRSISYGLQSPYGFEGSLGILAEPGVVMVADGSPYVQTSKGDNPGMIKTAVIPGTARNVVDWNEGSASLSRKQKKLWGNSPNHGREGQNVGYFDGHAEWMTQASCGKDLDNIYTANGRAGAAAKTAISLGGSLMGNSKNNKNDTLILP
jgi:prepilin-type N-terminal cleavage/methylation domain-containing protein/prepilin-type processing-associated H-X9-DG protein